MRLGFVAAVMAASLGLFAPAQAADFAYGADIGWVTQQEAEGVVFKDAAGAPADAFVVLKAVGIDAVRLRVWVNPAKQWNAREDVLAKAKRAAAHGQKVMINFHYSDNWADPGKQNKPAAWAAFDATQVTKAVYDHTHEILTYLKTNGIDVAWVQPGNEITNGMLWPEGKTSNFDNIAAYSNAGYAATKAVYPNAAVIVHIDNGWNTEKCRWWYESFFKAGGKADIIGLSYYPHWSVAKDWKLTGPMLTATMNDLVARHGKPIMVVETGAQWDQPEVSKMVLDDVIARTKALGDKGLGVFYWEPLAEARWSRYQLSSTNTNGQLTAAMDAFKH